MLPPVQAILSKKEMKWLSTGFSVDSSKFPGRYQRKSRIEAGYPEH